MNALNALFTTLAGWLLKPLAALPPLAVLLIVSAVAGALMTLVFGFTSNQKALRRAADQIKASLLAMRLFRDDLGGALRCQGELFKAIGLRLLHSLPPLLVMILPITLLLIQLALWFEHRPLKTGEAAIVELRVGGAPAGSTALDPFRDMQTTAYEAASNSQPSAARGPVLMAVPPDGDLETPPLFDAFERTVAWRIRCATAQPRSIEWPFLRGAGEPSAFNKQLAVADDPARLRLVSVLRPGANFWDRLLNPAEPAFPPGHAIQSVVVHYPRRATPIFGWDVPWWLTFFVASMVFALLARPFLKVQF